MITIQQQTCYCDMFTLNSYIVVALPPQSTICILCVLLFSYYCKEAPYSLWLILCATIMIGITSEIFSKTILNNFKSQAGKGN